ncbi:MAG: peptidyl-prolyl cis-trans isomerase [Planctomycetota bacterium]
MSNKPNLQIGDPTPGLTRRGSSMRGVWLLAVLQLATLAVVGFIWASQRTDSTAVYGGTERLETLRSIAISLEDRSLAPEAAAAWREYLRQNGSGNDRAQVLYRIGGLLMDAEDFSGAAAAFVESEQFGANDERLKSKLGPKIVECLRKLGRYGEVGRELSRQVEVGGDETAQGNVLATFAGDAISEADLDRMIERSVDRLLAMQPGGPSQVQREELLKQYESGEARQRMLQEILQRELFSRRARELEIDKDTSFRKTREFVETELLAGQFLSRELGKIQPTEVDIQSFYEAHASDYRQPETLSAVVLPLEEGQNVDEVLSEIRSADDFLAMAKGERDEPEKVQLVKGQTHPRFGDTSQIFALSPGEWTKKVIGTERADGLMLVESKSPAAAPPLDQVRFRVVADYRQRKRQELMQRLSEDLMSRYDVKVFPLPERRSPNNGDRGKNGAAK